MLHRSPALLLSLALAACAAPQAEVLSRTASYPPTARVEVLLEMPGRPHQTFAILEDRWGGEPEEINARLIEKGRELGADAVVIVGINDRKLTDWVLIDPYYTVHGVSRPRYRPVKHSYRSVRAKAVKYLSPP